MSHFYPRDCLLRVIAMYAIATFYCATSFSAQGQPPPSTQPGSTSTGPAVTHRTKLGAEISLPASNVQPDEQTMPEGAGKESRQVMGKVDVLSGQSRVVRANGIRFVGKESGVHTGDIFLVGPDASLGLKMRDGTTITLGKKVNSRFTFTAYRNRFPSPGCLIPGEPFA